MARFENAVELRIDAAPEVCYQAMTEFESYPEWQSAVVEARVVEPSEHEPLIAFTVDILIRKIQYTLKYSLDPEQRSISWDLVEGDAETVSGAFTAEPSETGGTLATYALEIQFGFWLPGFIERLVRGSVMRGVLTDLKQRVEG